MEEEVLATLEGLAEVIGNGEEPLVFWQYEQDTLVILRLDSGIGGGGEGSGGGGDGDKLTKLESEPSDSEREEEDEVEEDMVDPNLEWMTQGPLALLVFLHKMSKWAKRMNIKFNPNSIVNIKDHLDKFYLQLQTPEVRYDDVACRLFPCTLDGHATAWYQILPMNSIHNWGAFKHIFLENFCQWQDPSHATERIWKPTDG